MANLARSGAQSEIVRNVARFIGSPNDIESWITSHSIYRGEYNEIVREPEWMLNDFQTLGYMEGDCDDFATLSASLAKAQGYDANFAAVKTTPDLQEFDHVFTEASDGFSIIRIDPTVYPWIEIPEYERINQYV